MKRKLGNVLCAVLAGLMIMSLTGCGKDSSAGGDDVLKVKFTHVVAEATPKKLS